MVPNDVDGDGASDLTVFWPETGNWYVQTSQTWEQRDPVTWGKQIFAGEMWAMPTWGDFDGDRIGDMAAFFPKRGEWYVRQSSTRTTFKGGAIVWGKQTNPNAPSALPVPGDYDGDRLTDIAVFFPHVGLWHILKSSTWTALAEGGIQWGWLATVPVPGDYDGDKRTDLAVYWPEGGRWYILLSSTWTMLGGPDGIQWGWRDTVPAPGDFDGDGKTDLAVYWAAGGKWFVLLNGTWTTMAGTPLAWPAPADVDPASLPVSGDFNGDRRADFGVYVPATGLWHVWLNGPDDILGGTPIRWGWSETDPVR